MKNSVGHFNSRTNRDEERICEPEDKKFSIRGQQFFFCRARE